MICVRCGESSDVAMALHCSRKDCPHGATPSDAGMFQRELILSLSAALREMLVAHSMENVGVDASMRRIRAKQTARKVLEMIGKDA